MNLASKTKERKRGDEREGGMRKERNGGDSREKGIKQEVHLLEEKNRHLSTQIRTN